MVIIGERIHKETAPYRRVQHNRLEHYGKDCIDLVDDEELCVKRLTAVVVLWLELHFLYLGEEAGDSSDGLSENGKVASML